jgi:hypothetical protein
MSLDAPMPEVGEPCVPATWGHLKKVLKLLEDNSVDYVLVGGFAMNLLGLARFTGDIDILVRVSADNNQRWIRALSQLPDGVASELAHLPNPFLSEEETPSDEEEDGVVRIFDVVVVDVMPKACGRTYDDLVKHSVRVVREDIEFSMLDPEGMMLTKQGMRPKDKQDKLWLIANKEKIMENLLVSQLRAPKP